MSLVMKIIIFLRIIYSLQAGCVAVAALIIVIIVIIIIIIIIVIIIIIIMIIIFIRERGNESRILIGSWCGPDLLISAHVSHESWVAEYISSFVAIFINITRFAS